MTTDCSWNYRTAEPLLRGGADRPGIETPLEFRGIRTEREILNRQSINYYLTGTPTHRFPHTGHENLTKAFAKCGNRPAAVSRLFLIL